MILHETDGPSAVIGVPAFLLQLLGGPFETGPSAAAVGVATSSNLSKVLVTIHFYLNGTLVGIAEQPGIRFKRGLKRHLVARNLLNLNTIKLPGIRVRIIEQILHMPFREEAPQLPRTLRRCPLRHQEQQENEWELYTCWQ